MTSEVTARVRARLIEQAPDHALTGEHIKAMIREEAPLLGAASEAAVLEAVLADVNGLGPLEPLLADPSVTDVLVNGDGPVWIERHGRLQRTDIRLAASDVQLLIERIVGPLGLRADRASPLVDARLSDGSRVHAVVPPLAVDGPCLTIRRFGAKPVPLESFAAPEVVAFLSASVRGRANILIGGGTGAGKTTLLNALAAQIPDGDRIVTIEDAAELRLGQSHVVRLEARPPNTEGAGAVTVRELVRNALRMRPDRIVVGECRGGEALDMLQAMNTGHEGSLSTCHSNGPEDSLRRLETMVLMAEVGLPLDAVRDQLAAALDLVLHVHRRRDGERRIAAVAEVLPFTANGPRVRLLATGNGVVAEPQRQCLDRHDGD